MVLLAARASGLEANAPVHWRARSVSRSPYFPRSPWFSPAGNARTETDVRMGAEPVAVGDPATGTGAFDARALRAFPNPFASASLIRYEVPERGHVELAIFDVQGRLVRTLVDAVQLEGPQAMAWDGRDDRGTTSSPGVYLLRLTIAGVERVEKLVRDR